MRPSLAIVPTFSISLMVLGIGGCSRVPVKSTYVPPPPDVLVELPDDRSTTTDTPLILAADRKLQFTGRVFDYKSAVPSEDTNHLTARIVSLDGKKQFGQVTLKGAVVDGELKYESGLVELRRLGNFELLIQKLVSGQYETLAKYRVEVRS